MSRTTLVRILAVGALLSTVGLTGCGSGDEGTSDGSSVSTNGAATSPESAEENSAAEEPKGELPGACSLLDVEKVKAHLTAGNYSLVEDTTLEEDKVGETASTCKVSNGGGTFLESLSVQAPNAFMEKEAKAGEPVDGLTDAYYNNGWYAFRDGWVIRSTGSNNNEAALGIFKDAVAAFEKR